MFFVFLLLFHASVLLDMALQTLFWLPKELPAKVVTMVVTCRDDNTDIISELKQRGYANTSMVPLTVQQQKDFCVVSEQSLVLS